MEIYLYWKNNDDDDLCLLPQFRNIPCVMLLCGWLFDYHDNIKLNKTNDKKRVQNTSDLSVCFNVCSKI